MSAQNDARDSEMPEDLGSRMWEGDPTSVSDAYNWFRSHPLTGLNVYAVALYSNRGKKENKEKLIRLRRKLSNELLRRYWMLRRNECSAVDILSPVETFGTHLEWISRQNMPGELLSFEPQSILNDLEEILEGVQPGVADIHDPERTHDAYLFELLRTRVLLRQKKQHGARAILDWVASFPQGGMVNVKQRVRVLAKLGFLYRLVGVPFGPLWWRGIMWGVSAVRIRGVPRNVRIKALVALLPRWILAFRGIDP
jgi:hypothetical protein